MTQYILNLQIAATDLSAILAARESIVVVKTMTNAGNPVAWAVAAPAQNVVVTWSGDYAVYASMTSNATGAQLTVAASSPAIAQSDYSYAIAGFSAPTPDPQLGPGQYLIWNQIPASQQGAITLGLAQCCSINGNPPGGWIPINAETVPANQYTQLQAGETVLIYLQSGISAGTVIAPPRTMANATSTALKLVFSPSNATQTVRYNAQAGMFYLVS